MMAKIDRLAQAFASHVSIGWPDTSSGAQRVLMIVYDPADERSVRRKLELFAQGARAAGKAWSTLDLSPAIAQWIAQHRYRDAYFEDPELFYDTGEDRIAAVVADKVAAMLADEAHGPDAILAITGVGSLYGFASLSNVLSRVEHAIRGCLVVFFPGRTQEGRYRLLDARESWDYHAVPITLDDTGDI